MAPREAPTRTEGDPPLTEKLHEPSEEAIGEAHEVFVFGIRGGEVPRNVWAALDAAIRAAYRVDFGGSRG